MGDKQALMRCLSTADLARVVYEATRAYARTLDETYPPWDEATQADRDLWCCAALFQRGRPDMDPEAAHDYWLVLESSAGWSYGPTLDNAAKRHPYHVPWAYLPEPHRAKIHLGLAIVRALGVSHGRQATAYG